MKKFTAGTIVTKNYLPFARVVAQSFKKFHPDIAFYVLIADDPDGCFNPRDEPFNILRFSEIAIPRPKQFCFRYTRQQLMSAAKPFFLGRLLKMGYENAVFLDADILVLANLKDVLENQSRHAISLMPHFLKAPAVEQRFERELNIALTGVFNAGFVGVNKSETAERFLTWWQQRLERFCRHEVGKGMYFDQKWLDLAPAYFSDVNVIRDAGCNVAYWNLSERNIKLIDGRYVLSDGNPCRFFHFSGMDPEQPDLVSAHSSLGIADIGDAALLFSKYRAQLDEQGYQQTKQWPYTYGAFENGTSIPDAARELYLDLEIALASAADPLGRETAAVSSTNPLGHNTAAAPFADPFAAGRPDSFFEWLNSPVDGITDSSERVTQLWQGIYERRADVRRAFPDFLGCDREAFLYWSRNTGMRESGVAESLTPSTWPDD